MIKENVFHYLPGDIRQGDIMQKITNGNIVGKRILKFGIFAVTSFLKDPLDPGIILRRYLGEYLLKIL